MPLAGKELEAFLEEPHLAHFATIGSDAKPRVRPLWFCLAEGALWFTIRLEARRTGADPPCSRSLPAPTIIASAEPRSNAITNRSAGAPPLIAADDVSTPSSAAIPSTDVTKFP